MRSEPVELFACTRRRYRWPAGPTEAHRVAWETFLQARGIVRDAFLIEDPCDPVRELGALEPAVGDGARVTFSLPTVEASPDFRWYPKQGMVVGHVNGVAAALASVDMGARTVTFAAAPDVGVSVAATYRGLWFVRLVEPPTFQGVTKRFRRYALAIEEILRDGTELPACQQLNTRDGVAGTRSRLRRSCETELNYRLASNSTHGTEWADGTLGSLRDGAHETTYRADLR